MTTVITYDIEHRTRYRHASRVTTSHHVAYLEPRATARQRLVWHALDVTPVSDSVTRRIDYFGNVAHHLTMLAPYAEFEVTSRARVEVTPPVDDLDASASLPWEDVRAHLASAEAPIDEVELVAT